MEKYMLFFSERNTTGKLQRQGATQLKSLLIKLKIV